jgi:hypothetical protein
VVDKLKIQNILKRDIEDKRSFWSSYKDPKNDNHEESTYSRTLTSSVKGSYDVRQAYKKQHPHTTLTEESAGAAMEQSLLTPKGPQLFPTGVDKSLASPEIFAKETSNKLLIVPKSSYQMQATETSHSSKFDHEFLSSKLVSPRAGGNLQIYQAQESKKVKANVKAKTSRSVLNFHSTYQPTLITTSQCKEVQANFRLVQIKRRRH